MKTLTQHIKERLIINKNFKQETFKPNNKEELKDYISSKVDELIKNKDDIIDLSNVDLSLISQKPSYDKSLYQIFREPLSKIKNNFITVDVSNWDVTEYDRLDCLFFDCPCIETVIGLETWDVSNIKDFTGFFSQCSNLKNVNVSGWKLHNATMTYAMFYDCKNLKKIYGIDTWEFDDNNRINMTNMFYNCSNLTDIGDIDYWENVVGYKKGMFYNCKQLTLPTWY